ncbi:MAG: class I SAM-dependent methyltransferase [Chloroflexota bacterium]|nr:class I SAM-dependent methyltransferase [Chloroflexota bacterium]
MLTKEMNIKIAEVMAKIEKMSSQWSYTLTKEEAQRHSFGRTSGSAGVGLWPVPDSTGLLLETFAVLTQAKVMLELGCSSGYSTLFLARVALRNDGHVYTTEILPAKIALARQHFREAGVEGTITLLEQDIRDVLAHWPPDRVIDLVFMDADKERYGEYYTALVPLLRPGGLIVADNATDIAPMMRDFLTQATTDSRVVAHLLQQDNGLMIICKR